MPLQLRRAFSLGPCTGDTTYQAGKALARVAGRTHCSQVAYVLEALCTGEACLLPASPPLMVNSESVVWHIAKQRGLWDVHFRFSSLMRGLGPKGEGLCWIDHGSTEISGNHVEGKVFKTFFGQVIRLEQGDSDLTGN